MEADRLEARVLDDRLQFPPPLRPEGIDPGGQGERCDLQAVVTDLLDGPADPGEVPAFE